MNSLKKFLKRWAKRGAIILAAAAISWNNPITCRHYDSNGVLKGVYTTKNGIVDVGINKLLDVMFHADAQITTWYMGLVDNSGFTAFDNGDTMSSHGGWNEFTTYSETTRVTWTEDAAASRSISNSTSVDFSINGSGTVKGVFVTSDNTKSGTTGTLWATAAFSSAVSVVNGDSLKITYTISG